MKPRPVRALLRAAWLSAISYRVSMVLSLGSLVLTVVPIYFVAQALQPLMGPAIAHEGQQYFAFMLLGTIALSFVTTSVSVLPGAIGGGIASGYVESLFMTPAPRISLFVGLSAYPLIWTSIRAGLILVAGSVLGARVAWSHLPAALLILSLLVAAHWAIGLFGTALILAYRTMGPLPQVVLVLSALFGGTYYPTSSIPSWLRSVAAFTPLAYGLRALRRTLLGGGGLISDAGRDVAILTGIATVLLAVGLASVRVALRYSQRRGSLNLY